MRIVIKDGKELIGEDKKAVLDDFIDGQSTRYEKIDKMLKLGLYILIDFYGKVNIWRKK